MNFNTVPIKRPDVFESYISVMSDYLKRTHPEFDYEEIREWIADKVNRRVGVLIGNLERARNEGSDLNTPRFGDDQLWPTLRCIRSSDSNNIHNRAHVYGDYIEIPDMDLYKFTKRYSDKIISPFGVVFETTDKCVSYLKGMIDMKKSQRKQEKKLMLKAKKECNKVAEVFHNNNQSTIKVLMNSIAGGMGSGFSSLSSVADFNSVTSIGRFFIMNSYAHAERFLESNFYFLNTEQVINFLMGCLRCGPDSKKIDEIMDKYCFIYPSFEMVEEFLFKALKRYDFLAETSPIDRLLRTFSKEQLCFVFYMSNMKHLVFTNDSWFRDWTQKLFDFSKVEVDQNIVPDDINNIDGDVAIILSTVCNEMLPLNDKGNAISIYDCIKVNPELARRLAAYGKHLEIMLKGFMDVFDLFMNHNVNVSYVVEHKNQYRDAVVVSDTDSIIFTTKSWLQWYKGNTVMDSKAYQINSLIVYWLSKANANVLFHVSEAFGALGKDLTGMAMKNEFMMPVDILTSLKKHYASILKIQEGVVFKTPRLDIKGVGLRGSNFSKGVLSYTEWFIRSVIDDIYSKSTVIAEEKLIDVLRFERMIRDSLRHLQTEFLPMTAIKNKEEYANANSSVYFNYLLWEEVFGDKYGKIQIPTKCYIVPLFGMESLKYQDWLKEKDFGIYQKLMRFKEKYPDKDLNRIPINPSFNIIPAELQPVIDYNKLVSANSRPLYLILGSLGISVGDAKKDIIFSNVYGWVSEEEGKKALAHVE